MSHVEPTLSFHVARAYGVGRTARPQRLAVSPLRHADEPQTARLIRSGPERLVAGVVPGGVEFSAGSPMPTSPAIPMYRHPADRNAVAVSIHAGRMIDVTG